MVNPSGSFDNILSEKQAKSNVISSYLRTKGGMEARSLVAAINDVIHTNTHNQFLLESGYYTSKNEFPENKPIDIEFRDERDAKLAIYIVKELLTSVYGADYTDGGAFPTGGGFELNGKTVSVRHVKSTPAPPAPDPE